ncbi:MAG: hypothetical protein ABIE94_02475 [archaeon]
MKKKVIAKESKKTKKQSKGWLFWTPRILALAFIAFMVLMSFDAFEGPGPWYMLLLGFIIHLIPAFALAAVYFVARKKPCDRRMDICWHWCVLWSLLWQK